MDGKLVLEVNLHPGQNERANTTGTQPRSNLSKHKPNTFQVQTANDCPAQQTWDLIFQSKHTAELWRLHWDSNAAGVTEMKEAAD